jgi:hypothetical protein
MQQRLIGHIYVAAWGQMGLMRNMAMRHIQQEQMESDPLPKQNRNANIRRNYMNEVVVRSEHAIYTSTCSNKEAREVSSDMAWVSCPQ